MKRKIPKTSRQQKGPTAADKGGDRVKPRIVRRLDLGGNGLGLGADHGGKQGLLVGKVMVQRAPRHPGRRDDVRRACGRISDSHEQIAPRLNQRSAHGIAALALGAP